MNSAVERTPVTLNRIALVDARYDKTFVEKHFTSATRKIICSRPNRLDAPRKAH